MAFFEGALGWGGVPTGAGLVDGGGRPRALVPGEGWKGQGVRKGLAWWGQLRWVPPPHPTGHPSKNAIFLLFLH